MVASAGEDPWREGAGCAINDRAQFVENSRCHIGSKMRHIDTLNTNKLSWLERTLVNPKKVRHTLTSRKKVFELSPWITDQYFEGKVNKARTARMWRWQKKRIFEDEILGVCLVELSEGMSSLQNISSEARAHIKPSEVLYIDSLRSVYDIPDTLACKRWYEDWH